jgi:hypothetical protein
MYVLYIAVCPFLFFLLAIVFSVLRFMDSDYLFGIFKLFLTSPLFIEVPVPRGVLVVMYMCARGHVYVC